MDLGERLVGRADVKAAVVAALDEARSGAGHLLLISGEAGIGKSAVLSYLADAARDDCRVLRGFCLAGSGVPPYWPWIQVLRATGVAAGRSRRGRSVARHHRRCNRSERCPGCGGRPIPACTTRSAGC